ncbi:class I SAM-dependent methyltransferase [Bacillus sp. UNC438CL73TsuS30]|uniref:class I SAM-dependent methyltransferase n=1 Tax=Bacillus sp. UNC438CL73TsuS30 TaxID=1340434 RepID=UPI000479EDEB|nr:class I SAM-dependent methyltransferase [Bacillus sp. UNC438CL73TsuS30]
MNIFFEIHRDIPREGPGNNESTRKAYQLIGKYVSQPVILDIGSGPGMQTIELAGITDGSILAADLNEDFLKVLAERAEKQGFSKKIDPQKADMCNLPFEEEKFDVIWSEGAIYIIGFEKGLKEWKRFVKQDGIVAVTEFTWLKDNAPKEARDFWDEAYPGAGTIDSNVQVAESLGYRLIDSFVLPESAWWKDYYTPLEDRLSLLREKYKDHEDALKVIDDTQQEIDLYRNYHEYYGYVFYLFQKVD